ncbi:hypothetical protein [Flagellimonas sp.]|jgi:hypothetical protein|uniref:hypothetical protein n=1 Tax=Flagellimonas sp. TaxID=2058762 RepID=UPI003BABE1F8
MKFKLIVISVAVICAISCGSTKDKKVEKRRIEYLVQHIDSTKRYYLLNTIVENNDSIKLLIFKNSKQLRKKELVTGNKYIFKTYSWKDAINPIADYFHEVDGVIVWDTDSKFLDIHFTDGMGNGFLEGEEELKMLESMSSVKSDPE